MIQRPWATALLLIVSFIGLGIVALEVWPSPPVHDDVHLTIEVDRAQLRDGIALTIRVHEAGTLMPDAPTRELRVTVRDRIAAVMFDLPKGGEYSYRFDPAGDGTELPAAKIALVSVGTSSGPDAQDVLQQTGILVFRIGDGVTDEESRAAADSFSVWVKDGICTQFREAKVCHPTPACERLIKTLVLVPSMSSCER